MKMKRMKIRSGAILVLAVIMVVILFIIGLALIRLGLSSRLQAIHSQLVITARTAADAGMTTAIKMMRKKLADGSISNPPWPSATDVAVPGSNPPAIYTYTIVGNLANGWNIASTGMAGSAQRTVHIKLAVTPYPAIAVKNCIWVQKSDFPCGSITMQTNSTESGAITLKAGVTVNGDVVCGPGGDPAEVINTKQTTVITGYTYAAEEPIPFPPVDVPAVLQALPTLPYTYDPCGVTGDRHYGSITINDIQDIKGVTRIYIDGKLTLGNSAGIVVQPNSSLELYLNGNLEGKNSMGLDNLTNDSINLKIVGTDNCTFINLKAKSSSLQCDVYAPSADVTLFNSAKLYGTVVANCFTMKEGGSFCENTDPNSARYSLDPAQGCWWEE